MSRKGALRKNLIVICDDKKGGLDSAALDKLIKESFD